MAKKIYVVTNPELGWDCVVGVYENEEYVNYHYGDKEMYVIHTQQILKDKLDLKKPNQSLLRYGRKNIIYDIVPYEKCTDDTYLIGDSCDVTAGDFYQTNNQETISLIIDNFIDFCSENNINCGTCYLTTYEDNGKSFLCFCDGIKDADYSIEFSDYLEDKRIIFG